MKASEADILIIPGYKNSGPGHWQTRWEQKLSTARRVKQESWSKPDRQDWVNNLVEAVNTSTRPVVLVAHSLGIPTAVHAVTSFKKPVVGAFFVAPPEVENPNICSGHLKTFGPYPRQSLPFPSILIASRNDPFGSIEHAETLGKAWKSRFFDIGEAGDIAEDTGFGSWPEGILMFARFLAEQ